MLDLPSDVDWVQSGAEDVLEGAGDPEQSAVEIATGRGGSWSGPWLSGKSVYSSKVLPGCLVKM